MNLVLSYEEMHKQVELLQKMSKKAKAYTLVWGVLAVLSIGNTVRCLGAHNLLEGARMLTLGMLDNVKNIENNKT